MSVSDESLELTLKHLRRVRSALLDLHKALLESEKEGYERFYGPIRSKGEYFQLVISHEWFDWLRPISQFIVQMDDALSPKHPATLDQVQELLAEARRLLNPSDEGETMLEQRYYQAIQRDPDIAYRHAEMTQLLMSHRPS